MNQPKFKVTLALMTLFVALGFAWLVTPTIPTAQSALAQKKRSCSEFSELRMTLEQNATDGDTEVVLFAQGGDVGLDRFEITAPGGRRIAKFDGDGRGIGIREFLLESAEPPDLDAVLGSFPEGEYTFTGQTVTGDCLKGTASLSHDIVPATQLLTPAEEEVVPVDKLVLSWEPVDGVERYVVELNKEEDDALPGSEMTFEVFPPTTSVAIPAHFLRPGSEYQFVVGTKTENGNVTFVELTFFTADLPKRAVPK
jgi:hypothetical protein